MLLINEVELIIIQNNLTRINKYHIIIIRKLVNEV